MYQINKGINKPIEFKGLKAQYIGYLAVGLVILLIGFAIMYPETRAVALGALATQWSGQYTLFWRLPTEARETIRAGERGPAVQWLIGQLAQGLIPDGMVGPQTVVRLAGVGDRSAPELLTRQGSR